MDDAKKAENLKLLREEAVADLATCREELAAAQRQMNAAEERLALLNRLVELRGGALPDSDEDDALPEDLLDACERMMKEIGEPMHIKEMHQRLLEEGVPIPGRGREANLIVRLQRSEGRFVRVGRGTYALAEFGLPEQKPVRKRRKAVRRKKKNRKAKK